MIMLLFFKYFLDIISRVFRNVNLGTQRGKPELPSNNPRGKLHLDAPIS